MTGFGQATATADGRRITIEVRSVNQRFLDVKLNLPRECSAWEKELRGVIHAAVARGKVDVGVNRSGNANGEMSVEINQPLARAYVHGVQQLQRELGLVGQLDVSLVLNRSDVLRVVERRTDPQREIVAIRKGLKQALKRFNADREREGRSLARDLRQRIAKLRQVERHMRKRAADLGPALLQRLRERLQALLDNVPVREERLAQEIAILVERADVTEELVRLDSHLKGMEQAIASKEPAGRQLDFLLQEIHREVNTIASKSNDLEMTNLTIAARGEVEKLREQAQNVE
ncbi:MAG TPA: YicC/YloC family endoribonuclease [Candidatus Kryptonia bacterium]|nr:YicC/YloC family endoribonuclease [Candidatus Kryptonia bacterium]